ncbi:ash family protein [Actinobacillus pleuropneumoniae]|uniref:ash family protein n=1 Tax=Actinobacillus pleuropneumoniae TaxID=715 RepID=UPI001F2AC66B|nr:ash family protein [Actinobacillus pleuropneumoniae]UKH19986.1 hypothetical protein D1109_01935 [Actinobacillus pleuropneumoniae]UPA21799.1 ash family protein [Actinobacillus pleuropneumoniae]
MKQAYYTLNTNNIQETTDLNENLSLSKNQQAVYIKSAFTKSEVEPRNSNNLSVANITSTPLNYRAIFVCSTRTPKERYNLACSSMVACSGKGFALCCIPLIAVFEPVTRYRPNPRKFSGSLLNYSVELSAMIYKFLTLGKNRLKISILANSEKEARSKICFSSQAVLVARLPIPHQIAKFPQNLTACTAQGGIYA